MPEDDALLFDKAVAFARGPFEKLTPVEMHAILRRVSTKGDEVPSIDVCKDLLGRTPDTFGPFMPPFPTVEQRFLSPNPSKHLKGLQRSLAELRDFWTERTQIQPTDHIQKHFLGRINTLAAALEAAKDLTEPIKYGSSRHWHDEAEALLHLFSAALARVGLKVGISVKADNGRGGPSVRFVCDCLDTLGWNYKTTGTGAGAVAKHLKEYRKKGGLD